jgi:hypothetical protein
MFLNLVELKSKEGQNGVVGTGSAIFSGTNTRKITKKIKKKKSCKQNKKYIEFHANKN